jgi:hypothetical protein
VPLHAVPFELQHCKVESPQLLEHCLVMAWLSMTARLVANCGEIAPAVAHLFVCASLCTELVKCGFAQKALRPWPTQQRSFQRDDSLL